MKFIDNIIKEVSAYLERTNLNYLNSAFLVDKYYENNVKRNIRERVVSHYISFNEYIGDKFVIDGKFVHISTKDNNYEFREISNFKNNKLHGGGGKSLSMD